MAVDRTPVLKRCRSLELDPVVLGINKKSNRQPRRQRRNESEYDAFTAGHASTAISAALGMARTRDIMHGDFNVVALVGDGALTGGMPDSRAKSFEDREELVVTLKRLAKPCDVILFKASHGMHLELVLEAFLKKEK